MALLHVVSIGGGTKNILGEWLCIYNLASQTLFLENKVVIKQIIIRCGYSGRGYETEREMLTSHR